VNWYFDTSVLIAAAVHNHPHNAAAVTLLEKLARSSNKGFLSAHGLAEVYSVLTRLPLRPRIDPAEVLQIVDDQIVPLLELVPLTGKEYLDTVRNAGRQGLIGGRIHDAVHISCAIKAKCDRIYTFNVRDFRDLAPTGLSRKISAP
jgi:predicted nucleic acid-binding protein